MKTKLVTLIFFFTVLAFSCAKSEEPGQPSSQAPQKNDCQTNPSLRRGAICKDGTTSSATGSGACSGHGGVDYWLCK